ncbi:MAG TPA: hypothetical protein VLI04_11415 [Nocardioidaceae bacterium]|nr:hypothetical protein [Nocardioidaceae bacterium]
MKLAREIVAVGATAILVTTITPAPAVAADKEVRVYLPALGGPDFAGLGKWTDEDDTLCALLGQNQSHDKLVVRIRPRNGVGPSFRVIDHNPTPAASGSCTGDLSIPENRRYRMRVSVLQLNGDTYSVASNFRT